MLNDDPHDTQIEGAAALVTGGERGFGRAMVEELLDRGAAKVYATARSPLSSSRQPVIAKLIPGRAAARAAEGDESSGLAGFGVAFDVSDLADAYLRVREPRCPQGLP
jgi:NAD(P)-dependent dehydrogenase (short-subunit alcohol dehydrogenase family)